jgi:hypothetical protein
MLDRAICVATEALREKFGSIIESCLQPHERLVLWALLHKAGDAAWFAWQGAKGPEEVLAIFRLALEEAYQSLAAGLAFQPQAERAIVTMPEPDPYPAA